MPGDVAVAAAAADLAKVLERVWRGSGSGEGAFAKALERTRASAAELREATAAAAEMLDAAARHRDMVSSRSRFASRRLREERRRWLWLPALDLESVITRRGVHQQMRRGALGSLTRRPSRHLVRLRLRAVHLGPCAERPQPERTGCQFAGSGPKRPKPKTQNPNPPISLSPSQELRAQERGDTEARRAIWGWRGNGADALLPLRALLLQL